MSWRSEGVSSLREEVNGEMEGPDGTGLAYIGVGQPYDADRKKLDARPQKADRLNHLRYHGRPSTVGPRTGRRTRGMTDSAADSSATGRL